MIVSIDTSKELTPDWNASGSDRIVQNVWNLLHTFRYEVAYDRTMGLSEKFNDKPVDQVIAIATSEIYDLISEREPRAKVIEVKGLSIDNGGNLQFKVVIEI